MTSIFLRLYTKFIFLVIILSIAAFLALQVINKYRLEHYINDSAKGTMGLIADGLSRHEAQDREQWLNIVQRLTSMDIKLIRNHQKTSLSSKNPFLVKADIFQQKVKVWQVLVKDPEYIVEAQIDEIDGKLGRVTALLVLNELGRHSQEKRMKALKTIQQSFGYPILRQKRDDLHLSAAQIRRLNNGDVFTAIEDSTSNKPFLMVYAPYGRTGDVLTLGAIPLFVWYPSKLLMVFGLSSVFISMFMGYLMIRPLEKRFNYLIKAVDEIGLDKKKIELPDTHINDDLTRLTTHINNMSCRLHSLLSNQRELTHAVSHELRTPISRLRFRLELIDMEGQKNSRSERIAGMQKDLTELNNLVDEILTYAKLESEKPDLNIEVLSVSKMIEQLTNAIHGKDIDIDVQFSTHLERFVADSHYIQRLLFNLLGNALRHAKSKIMVSVWQQDQTVIWLVEDDGEGIAAENFEHIFEPFARIDASRNRQSGGYGLGLAISRQIAQWHQGSLNAIEPRQEKGACFQLILPLVHKSE